MPPADPRRGGARAGFTFIEVLAALVVTGAVVAAVLPYAARLASHWWVGEQSVEAADGWMQAAARMGDDLAQLPFATGLSRRTSRVIKQNLFFSLGVVAILVPATVLGLGIGPAVLVHEGSTLIVVFNALKLLAYQDA